MLGKGGTLFLGLDNITAKFGGVKIEKSGLFYVLNLNQLKHLNL